MAHLSTLDSLPLYTDVFTTDMGRAPMDMSECSDNPKWNYNTDFPNPTVGKKLVDIGNLRQTDNFIYNMDMVMWVNIEEIIPVVMGHFIDKYLFKTIH